MTIHIMDIMCLALLEKCKEKYDCSINDKGHHGVQLRCPYLSPGETSAYGTISLTFYSTTSRLLVQGTSYILWFEEHLPALYDLAHTDLMGNMSHWTMVSKQRGIGAKRKRGPSPGRAHTPAAAAATADTSAAAEIEPAGSDDTTIDTTSSHCLEH